MDYDKLWQTVLGEIEVGMSPANFQTWFKNTAIDDVNENKGVVIVRVPNDFTREWLQKKYQKEIHKCLAKHLGKVVLVQYMVGAKKPAGVTAAQPTLIDKPNTALDIPERPEPKEGLNPRFTFDTFVVGENSKLCHAAAQSVAGQPGVNYNPLFIYGGVGLGKTHLLQAIGNEIITAKPKLKVTYVTSERFTNEMVEAIRKKDTRIFKDKYRKADCLLIDDVQFLAGKEQTQEEFFHTFNTLYNAGKQIVLTSDRPPKAIPALEGRLRSRFECGMIADISVPSYETRLAILQTKLAGLKKELGQDILEYIAKLAKNNVRELEGSLTRVLAYADLNNTTPTLEDAKNLLGGIMTGPGKKVVKPSEIIRAVAAHFNLKREDLCGRKRNREIVIPRQILVYLLREELDMPYTQIGREVGGRDHTTVIHDFNKIRGVILKNEELDGEITQIKNRLYAVD
jgi:chromosomal replication initiator protein